MLNQIIDRSSKNSHISRSYMRHGYSYQTKIFICNWCKNIPQFINNGCVNNNCNNSPYITACCDLYNSSSKSNMPNIPNININDFSHLGNQHHNINCYCDWNGYQSHIGGPSHR